MGSTGGGPAGGLQLGGFEGTTRSGIVGLAVFVGNRKGNSEVLSGTLGPETAADWALKLPFELCE